MRKHMGPPADLTTGVLYLTAKRMIVATEMPTRTQDAAMINMAELSVKGTYSTALRLQEVLPSVAHSDSLHLTQ